MNKNNKRILRLSIIIILNIIVFSTLAYYRYGQTAILSLLGSSLFMIVIVISNFLMKYNNRTLNIFNNIITIFIIYLILSRLLLDNASALMIIMIYMIFTSDLLNEIFRKLHNKKLS